MSPREYNLSFLDDSLPLTVDVKQQTIEPTNIPITTCIFNFYDKTIEIMFSAVDSLSSIDSVCNIWSCNKHVKRVCIY